MSLTSPVGGRGAFADPRLALTGRAFLTQWRVLVAVLFKEASIRRGRFYTFGWLVGAMEPLIVVGAISLLFTLLDRTPPYGSSLLLFTGTGVFPMYLVIYTSMRVREPVIVYNAGRYPLETTLDEVVAHAVLHLVSTCIVATAYFTILFATGTADALPFDLVGAVSALSACFVMGVGLGIINSVIARFYPFWAAMWPALGRGLIHFSGLYIVADYLAPKTRQFWDINPILNCVTWFRRSFYPYYPEQTDHRLRVVLIALSALALGLVLERVLRRGTLRGDYAL